MHFDQNHAQQHDIHGQRGVTPFARTASSWEHAFPGRPGKHTIELVHHNWCARHKLIIFT